MQLSLDIEILDWFNVICGFRLANPRANFNLTFIRPTRILLKRWTVNTIFMRTKTIRHPCTARLVMVLCQSGKERRNEGKSKVMILFVGWFKQSRLDWLFRAREYHRHSLICPPHPPLLRCTMYVCTYRPPHIYSLFKYRIRKLSGIWQRLGMDPSLSLLLTCPSLAAAVFDYW